MGTIESIRKGVKKFLPGPALLAGLLLPAAAWGDEVGRLLEEEREQLSLYFSDEQLVEAATRHPKPLSQVAENVTVITAAEIEAMHAHTVAEVLERVPGVFVSFNGRDFASTSSLHIHGSDYEHVLVLVDGIRWNSVGSDFAETNQIPVEIIDRIEVIKGAASSAWGSALGGVVNIITKEAGRSARPAGNIALAVGEHGTRHYHGQAAGGAHGIGYYLFAGRRESDGIRDNRFFKDTNLFGKISYDLSRRTRLSGQIGYSDPGYKYLHLEDWDYASAQDGRLGSYAINLDNSPLDGIHFHLQTYGRRNRLTDTGREISSGALLDSSSFKDEQRGVNSRLAWEHGTHTIVVGAEYLYREVTSRDVVATVVSPSLSEEILALYINDSIRYGAVTVTPGIRFDWLTVGDNQVSPSLGATYQAGNKTILRALLSRGFRKPALFLKEGSVDDPPYISKNPELESETIWTYQAGFETIAIPGLWLQTTIFRHEADHVWTLDESWAYFNSGKFIRTGVEAAVRSIPLYNFSVGANYTIVREQPEGGTSDNLYKINLLLEYLHQDKGLHGQLLGSYVWWSELHEVEGKFSTMIWDMTFSKRLSGFSADLKPLLFFKIHNIFNGDHYWMYAYPNAPRWLEAGLSLHF